MSENNQEGMDFISLMKKKQAEEGKPSLVGEALDKADKAEEKAKKLDFDNLLLRKENAEYKEKNQELEKANKNLKENLDKTIGLLSKSEEAIKQAIEEKDQLEAEKHKQIQKMEFQINDLTNENRFLNEKIKKMEMEIKALTPPEEPAPE